LIPPISVFYLLLHNLYEILMYLVKKLPSYFK
jgi:hypothetical protein